MESNFGKAMAFLLKWEGGYGNDPADPGGETKFGICKRDHPDVDIKNLTVDQAREIYRKKYWEPAGCDDLLFPLDIITFDAAVNCGTKQSKDWTAKFQDPVDAIARRALYYLRVVKAKPQLKKFLKGWMNRISDLASMVL